MPTSSLRNARRWAPAGLRGWVFALLAIAVASAVRGALNPLFGSASPGFAYSIATAITEFYFGLGPAIATMLVGLFLADLLFVPPFDTIFAWDYHDVILAISYPAVTIIIISLIERVRRAEYRNELIAAVALSRYDILLRADNERLIARRDANETHRMVNVLTEHHARLIFIQALPAVTGQSAAARLEQPLAMGEGTQPCSRFDDVHPDDIKSALARLTLGRQRVRVRAPDRSGVAGVEGDGVDAYVLADAICERFTTPGGDFAILRLDAGA